MTFAALKWWFVNGWLEKSQILISTHIFFRVSADNNGLYNAASIFYIGNEYIGNILRILTPIEMFAHSDYYSSQLSDIWDSVDRSLFATK